MNDVRLQLAKEESADKARSSSSSSSSSSSASSISMSAFLIHGLDLEEQQ